MQVWPLVLFLLILWLKLNNTTTTTIYGYFKNKLNFKLANRLRYDKYMSSAFVFSFNTVTQYWYIQKLRDDQFGYIPIENWEHRSKQMYRGNNLSPLPPCSPVSAQICSLCNILSKLREKCINFTFISVSRLSELHISPFIISYIFFTWVCLKVPFILRFFLFFVSSLTNVSASLRHTLCPAEP